MDEPTTIINVSDAARFTFLPLSQVVLFGFYFIPKQISGAQLTSTDGIVTIVMAVLRVATDIGFYGIIKELMKKRELEKKQELQMAHYRALMERQQSVRKLRHDISNHLMTIEQLVGDSSPEAADYAGKLEQQFRAATTADYCDNDIVNAVLFSKAAAASESGVSFTVDASLSADVGVDELDMMSILSAMVEACLNSAKQAMGGFVKVKIRQEGGLITIEVSCSAESGVEVSAAAGEIDSIAKKYHGEYTFSQKDLVFSSSLRLTTV